MPIFSFFCYLLLYGTLAIRRSCEGFGNIRVGIPQGPRRYPGTLFSQNREENEVSDAEALLACYQYLRRRKRIGNWEQQERRQRMKAASSPHFFLEEDLSKIASRLHRERRDNINPPGDDDDDDNDDSEESEGDEARLRPSPTRASSEVWSGEFTSFPEGPSSTRERRSQSAKRTWMDIDFRKRWYEKRWADRVGQQSSETLQEKELELQVRALPNGFLGSDSLCEMTEDEIQKAIQNYLTTREKRAKSRRNTLNKRKAILDQQIKDATVQTVVSNENRATSSGSLLMMNENTLKEAQKRRSERAKALYEKRIQKKKKRNDGVIIPKLSKRMGVIKYYPTSATPRDSMIRIIHDLDAGILPTAKDIEIILKPGKLANRRLVLHRIITDCFGLRGRCIPVVGGSKEAPLQFVTSCPINDLGAFVIHLIRQRNRMEGAS